MKQRHPIRPATTRGGLHSRLSEPGNIAVWSFVAEVGYIEAANQIQMGEASLAVLRHVVRSLPLASEPGEPFLSLQGAARQCEESFQTRVSGRPVPR